MQYEQIYHQGYEAYIYLVIWQPPQDAFGKALIKIILLKK